MSGINIKGFKGNKNWYKGNLHSHTTVSDGRLEPKEAVELYKENGYSFMCLSEHDIYTDFRDELNSEGFILLPGIECSSVLYDENNERKKIHHLHGILGTSEMQEKAKDNLFKHMETLDHPPFEGAKTAQDIADLMAKKGCISTYNHPLWSRVDQEDFINTKGIFALEIYNHGTVLESNTGYDTTHWDTMLRQGNRVFAFASDDNHNEDFLDDSFGGWIMVNAESLEHDNIVNALIEGNYYSSSGPEIYDFGIKDGVAYVECSPVNHVHFMSGNAINGGFSYWGEPKEDSITRAEFKLRGNETYIRIECVDKYGKKAWSNPIFMDDFEI